jgi:hypothetical protein
MNGPTAPSGDRPATGAGGAGKAASGLLGLAVSAGIAWYFLGGGHEMHAAHEMKELHIQVTHDLSQQYELVKRNGTAMDRCIQAGLVAQGFLQARDDYNYEHWKRIEKADCRSAGMPR